MKLKWLFTSVWLLHSGSPSFAAAKEVQKVEDKYLWLEDILSEKSMKWVNEQNKKTIDHLQKNPYFKESTEVAMEILSRKDKIRGVKVYDEVAISFWTDAENPRGLLQMMSRKDFMEGKKNWETILDIDALNKKEKASWVYKGMDASNQKLDQVILALSPGGSDARVLREFDIKNKKFVENGFYIPEGKSWFEFLDSDTILLSDATTDVSKTSIGYPRVIKLLKRGQKIADSKIVFEAKKEDLSANPFKVDTETGYEFFVQHGLDFHNKDYYWLDQKSLQQVKLPFPRDFDMMGIWKGMIILRSTKLWTHNNKTVTSGSIIGFYLKDFLEKKNEKWQVIMESNDDLRIASAHVVKNYLYVVGTKNVSSKIFVFESNNEGQLQKEELPIEENSSASIVDSHFDSDYLQLESESFVNPSQQFHITNKNKKVLAQSQPTKWDNSNYEAIQHWVKSKDGVNIPYYVLKAKNLKLDGKNPTMLYGYGGFENSLSPFYGEMYGRLWLDKGGVFVLSNIRGGGEFGPDWHQSAIMKNKQKSYDDFIAIAEDLIAKKITSPAHLGISGGSNGGLLVGAVAVQRPDLFNAVLCDIPLLDMMRYTVMKNARGEVVGQSWSPEYGDPIKDPEMAKVIMQYSPYQNLVKGKKYPKIFFSTSTRDDRVVPSHARKMAAKMQEMGHPFWYYENIEGGHGAGADLKQRAFSRALQFSYLFEQLAKK